MVVEHILHLKRTAATENATISSHAYIYFQRCHEVVHDFAGSGALLLEES
jgi:hypothetical protein